MGKISKAFKYIALDTETKLAITDLDKRMTNLETYFEDHQAIENKNSFLKQPPPKRTPSDPYNAEQGTGTPPPRVIMSNRTNRRPRKR